MTPTRPLAMALEDVSMLQHRSFSKHQSGTKGNGHRKLRQSIVNLSTRFWLLMSQVLEDESTGDSQTICKVMV